MRCRRSSSAVALALLAAVLCASPLFASPPAKIKAKQREAEVVLAQVSALDRQLGKTVEAWDGAQYDLGKVRAQLASNHSKLRVAERARRQAEHLVQARLVQIYESDQPTTIDVVLGSTSLGDLIDRLQAEQSVATSDRQLAKHATEVRDQLATAQATLQATEHKRAAALHSLSSQRQQISAMLGQRRRLLSSVQSQLAALRAAEARRQAALAAEARRRLAAEQAQLRAQAAQRAHAVATARAHAKTKAKATQPPPKPAPATTVVLPATTILTTTTTPIAFVDPTTTAPVTTTDPTATDPTSTEPAPPTLPAGHPEAATIALKYLGVKYVWGGESPKGFDCSGLVAYVYGQLGITLPHYAAAQYSLGVAVPRDQLQPGDLVFFDALDHVGIYIGDDEFVHAPHTGDVVKITSLAEYGPGYVGARRL